MKDEIGQVLDKTRQALQRGAQADVGPAMDRLAEVLRKVRRTHPPKEWEAIVAMCREHAIMAQIHEDPLTRRAYDKPDGYPGDARLLDLIYGRGRYAESLRETTELGQRIYVRTRMAPASVAVRNRCDRIADEIGAALKRSDAARILSVACGHLREGERIPWEFVTNLDRFVALDNDEASLEDVASRGYHPDVACVKGTIRDLILDNIGDEGFDLIYALGIYDYLNRRTARRLTKNLFRRLRPGGKLVIANFVPDAADIGYMETFMDWYLRYRDEEEIPDIASDIDSSAISRQRIYREPAEQIVFLELLK